MTHRSTFYRPYPPAEFNRRVEEGIRRAPEERAKALREFFSWLARH